MSPEPGPEAQLMSIKQVVEATGIPAATIRYYDQQFEEFLRVQRGAGRRRMFSPGAVERLLEVRRLLKEESLSVRQARRVLSGGGAGLTASAGAGEVAALKAEVEDLKRQVAALEEQVTRLRDIQSRTLALVDGMTG